MIRKLFYDLIEGTFGVGFSGFLAFLCKLSDFCG
jgi:hypothetical protein